MVKGVAIGSLIVIAVLGCGRNPTLAPIVGESGSNKTSHKSAVKNQNIHTVKRGETLYSIAFKYGQDYRAVAKRNDVATPYTIYPGQELYLTDEANKIAANSSQTPRKKKSKTAGEDNKEKLPTQSVRRWVWPAGGKVLTSYSASGRKGIDISGRLGEPVKAAADGKVVYSGGGLIGYGELIIIKHNKNYLSAYGHNDKLLVKQGDFVGGGQKIATMGRTGTDKVKLHFEIRRDGKPVDPIRYLPK